MAQTDTQTHGHGNSMTESAQWGQFSENYPLNNKFIYQTFTTHVVEIEILI